MTLDLDELERIGKAATSGPWEAYQPEKTVAGEWLVRNPRSQDVVFETVINDEPDARFAAAARNNWQDLLDAIRRLRNVLDADREGGGETIGDTLIRMASAEVDEDWREWLKDYGARINQALEPLSG